MYLTLHDITGIRASAGGTRGAPLVLTTIGTDGRQTSEVVLFTDDFALARTLATAINEAVREHKAAAGAVRETALGSAAFGAAAVTEDA